MTEVVLRSRVLALGLNHPDESILAMYINHSQAKYFFEEAVQDVVARLAHMQIMVRSTDMHILLPMGGRLMFGDHQSRGLDRYRGTIVHHKMWLNELADGAWPELRLTIKPVYTNDQSGVK